MFKAPLNGSAGRSLDTAPAQDLAAQGPEVEEPFEAILDAVQLRSEPPAARMAKVRAPRLY